MGKRREKDPYRSSKTLPSSPSRSFSSSSSSDFEFTVSLSPRRSAGALFRPADELFYKGQLLPLHPSPRISMVRTLLLASSSTSSSSDANTTASRSSGDSASSFGSDFALLGDCDSSRPSSVTEDDEFRRLHNFNLSSDQIRKGRKYFSLARFSSAFKKEAKIKRANDAVPASSVKRMSATAREVVRKYLKKVKPLYEKLSQKQQQQQKTENSDPLSAKTERSEAKNTKKDGNGAFSYSFSGNLKYPRRRSSITSCPSSMRSSPTHSGVLSRNGFPGKVGGGGGVCHPDNSSSMEELQSAIQSAIAHCKKSMTQLNKKIVSNEI